MPSTRSYRWQTGDQLWYLAGRYLAPSGYDTVSEFAEAIRASNPQILSWSSPDIAVGTLVSIPYIDS